MEETQDYMETAAKKRARIMARLKIRGTPKEMDSDDKMNEDGEKSEKN